MKPNKIYIIGGPGSGKSYAANKLSKSLKLACVYKGSDPKIIGLTGMDHPLLQTLVSYSDIDDYSIRSIDYRDLKGKIVNLCYLHLN